MTAAVRRRALAALILAAILVLEVTGTGPLACQPPDHSRTAVVR